MYECSGIEENHKCIARCINGYHGPQTEYICSDVYIWKTERELDCRQLYGKIVFFVFFSFQKKRKTIFDKELLFKIITFLLQMLLI
jgi:hypothetical protein